MNRLEVDEILNLAIMSKTPYIIVEGVDDIRIYEEIAKSANISCEVYSVLMVEGLSGGNDGVIQAMEAIENLPMPNGKSPKDFVMGVIDCDARYYRGEMPTLSTIFSLNLYSIESHFVSKCAIKSCVDQFTRISIVDEVDVESIYSKVEKSVSDTYYFSLDALKNAVDPGYQSVVGFSANAGRRKDINTIADLQVRKADLDAFAATWQLTERIDSLRKFVKGKWLLTAYTEELFSEFKELAGQCKRSLIKQCRMCELDIQSPCLYQIRDGLSKNSLYSVIKDLVSIPDFDYIRDAFKSLSATAMAKT